MVSSLLLRISCGLHIIKSKCQSKFSKASSIAILYSKCGSELCFENFGWSAHHFALRCQPTHPKRDAQITLNEEAGRALRNLQGGEDSYDTFSCRSFVAKEPLIIGLFCGKWPMKIRHPMTLGHPIPQTSRANPMQWHSTHNKTDASETWRPNHHKLTTSPNEWCHTYRCVISNIHRHHFVLRCQPTHPKRDAQITTISRQWHTCRRVRSHTQTSHIKHTQRAPQKSSPCHHHTTHQKPQICVCELTNLYTWHNPDTHCLRSAHDYAG